MTNEPRKAISRTCLALILTALYQAPGTAQQQASPTTQPQKDTTDGFDYSFDRLSFELTKSLGDRSAFVIWLFDKSGSVTERRTKVIDRLQQIYGSGKRPNSLYSAAVGFGNESHFLTPNPVEDVSSLKAATEAFRPDDSGVERVFTTVVTVLDHWNTFIKEKHPLDVSIVIATDERGDDQESLEDAVNACREHNVRVFCLGNASRFGNEKGLVRYTYPDGFSEMIPVESGPETAFADVLNFEIWPHPTREELKRLSSGFGPWALERLCAESGGRYFIIEDTASQHFAKEAMVKCMPDRDSLPEQQRKLEANVSRRVLVEAAQTFNRNYAYQPRTVFRADTQSTLRAELTEAQKTLTILDHRLAQAEETLRGGLDDRDGVTGTRWQVAYDLALGRVLACRFRLNSLKLELARMKASPVNFENAQNNTWSIVSAEDVRVDLSKDGSLAKLLLKRVTTDHPDTPFAFFAEAELKRGFGWKWEETHRVYSNSPQKVFRPLLNQEVDPKNGGDFFGGETGKRGVNTWERPGL